MTPLLRRCLYACVLALAPVAFLAGCSPTNARVGVGLPPGLLYKNYQGPLGVARGEDGPPRVILPDDYKTGSVKFRRVIAKIPPGVGPPIPGADPLSAGWGDGSWKTAMENGGLTEAWFADYREFEILMGVYTEIEIIVYGR